MYSIRRVTSVVGGQSVWCEEKVCIIRMSESVQYQESHICSTRGRLCSMRRKCTV